MKIFSTDMHNILENLTWRSKTLIDVTFNV